MKSPCELSISIFRKDVDPSLLVCSPTNELSFGLIIAKPAAEKSSADCIGIEPLLTT